MDKHRTLTDLLLNAKVVDKDGNPIPGVFRLELREFILEHDRKASNKAKKAYDRYVEELQYPKQRTEG